MERLPFVSVPGSDRHAFAYVAVVQLQCRASAYLSKRVVIPKEHHPEPLGVFVTLYPFFAEPLIFDA